MFCVGGESALYLSFHHTQHLAVVVVAAVAAVSHWPTPIFPLQQAFAVDSIRKSKLRDAKTTLLVLWRAHKDISMYMCWPTRIK